MAAEDNAAADPSAPSNTLFEQQNRSRNLLARIRSILSRMAETNPSASGFAGHLEGRLSALWRAEEAFHRNGADLELIILDELQTYVTPEAAVTLKGPALRLDAKVSTVVILAMHELATNALKFGALGQPDGVLAISWSISQGEAGRTLRLKWQESGVVMIAKAPRHEGFGFDLITRRVAYELGGSGDLVLNPGGITCFMDIPLQVERP